MGEALNGLKRSIMCGEVRESNVSQKITLKRKKIARSWQFLLWICHKPL